MAESMMTASSFPVHWSCLNSLTYNIYILIADIVTVYKVKSVPDLMDFTFSWRKEG